MGELHIEAAEFVHDLLIKQYILLLEFTKAGTFFNQADFVTN